MRAGLSRSHQPLSRAIILPFDPPENKSRLLAHLQLQDTAPTYLSSVGSDGALQLK
jgi:hypothetical protein